MTQKPGQPPLRFVDDPLPGESRANSAKRREWLQDFQDTAVLYLRLALGPDDSPQQWPAGTKIAEALMAYFVTGNERQAIQALPLSDEERSRVRLLFAEISTLGGAVDLPGQKTPWYAPLEADTLEHLAELKGVWRVRRRRAQATHAKTLLGPLNDLALKVATEILTKFPYVKTFSAAAREVRQHLSPEERARTKPVSMGEERARAALAQALEELMA
jgi:hypothetical protein